MGNDSRGVRPSGVASETNLARRIRFERRRRQWSQEKLARLMSEAGAPMHQSSIAKIEREDARRPITVDEALTFAWVFDIPLIELLRSPEGLVSEVVEHLIQRCDALLEEDGRLQQAASRNAAELNAVKGQIAEAVRALEQSIAGSEPTLSDETASQLQAILRKSNGDDGQPR